MSGLIEWDKLENFAFDYAVSTPDGFTIDDLAAVLGVKYPVAVRVIRRLRNTLADDTINLIATPTGKGERWLYSLVGNLDEAKPWTRNRLRDAERRLETVNSIVGSVVTGSDGRTRDGKRARVMQKAVSRLIEDLGDIDEEFEEVP